MSRSSGLARTCKSLSSTDIDAQLEVINSASLQKSKIEQPRRPEENQTTISGLRVPWHQSKPATTMTVARCLSVNSRESSKSI